MMQNTSPRVVGRRALIKGTAMLAVAATARAQGQPLPTEQATTLADVPLGVGDGHGRASRRHHCSSASTAPFIPTDRSADAAAAGRDLLSIQSTTRHLRALVLFGHGEGFSRGVDVDAAQAESFRATPGERRADARCVGNSQPIDRSRSSSWRTATWNLGHEIYLASDVRVAAATLRSGRTRTRMAAFPVAAPRCVSSARRDGAMRCATC